MPYYTKEQIAKARETDLLTYLQRHDPQELVRISGNEYCTREHDSLRISNGKWYWWSRGIGGSTALDYLVKVKRLAFTDAVGLLLGCDDAAKSVDSAAESVDDSSKRLLLPDENPSADVVIRYLIGRGIDMEIVEACIREQLIYESLPYHNCVFVGYDEHGVARYAAYRSTGEERFLSEAAGSDKRYSFRIDCPGTTLHVFESAIDLLSYATIVKMRGGNWLKDPLLSLGGVYVSGLDPSRMKLPLALAHYLKTRPEIREVVLHLDNDFAGRAAAEAIMQQLSGKYQVRNEPPPTGKDYNDYLISQSNIKPQGEFTEFKTYDMLIAEKKPHRR